MVDRAPRNTRRPEEALLLACARTRLDGAVSARITTIVRGTLDWRLVLQLAALHGIRPLLYHNLNRVDPDGPPKAALDFLRGFFLLNTHRSLSLTAELLTIVHDCRDRGLTVVALKGPALSHVYGHLGLREFADLDLLVARGDLDATAELLMARGYTLQEGDDLEREDGPSYARRYLRDGGDTRVDVHWAVAPGHYGPAPDPESLRARLDRVPVADATLPSLGSVDLLIYLCVHGAKHGWERLKWLCDVAELIAAHPDMDWTLAMERAADLRGRRMVALGVVLAHDLLDAPVPAAVLERSRREPQVSWLAKRLSARLFQRDDVTRVPYSGVQTGERVEHPVRFGRNLLDGHFLRLLLLDGTDRARYAAYFLQPTPVDRAFVSLPAGLSFLYYVLRPVRLAWDYGVRPIAHRLSTPQ